jgi:cytochrome c oxidase subunit 2
MAIAVVLALLVIGSVLFNFLTPWSFTPLASNWGSIDTTIIITLAVTGVVTLLIAIFLIYVLIKYRTRPGLKAHYQPENKKLEWWLIGLSTVGIVAMLAPGLIVYNDYITVPEEAHEFEAVGNQWRWTFRYPGDDGVFGTSEPRFINGQNPLGLNPDDPNGQDDRIILANEVYVPVDQPVKALLRSVDVLHNFFVPQIRAKMDLVPGIVSWFWFTPTVEGRYEILCAELCGVGHYNMRGHMVIAEQEEFDSWLASKPTFAETLTMGTTGGLVEQGEALASGQGCVACHSVDGSPSLAPTWLNIFGRETQLADGSTIVVDEAYFRESITDPQAKLVAGFPPVMIAYDFSEEQLDALVAYARSLGSDDSGSQEAESTRTKAQPTQESGSQTDASSGEMPLAEQGAQVAAQNACSGCHSTDGSSGIGPTWQDLYGSERTFEDGTTAIADEEYLREAIQNPSAKIVEGYQPVMPPVQLTEEQVDALVAYAKANSSLSVEGE